MKQAQKGFTLVEIAIVLVIIGLLLGGILKGQEMITQAKIKNVMSDFSGISAAYHGYQDRYRAIPGDDRGADARWTLGIATPNGNGVIGGTYGSTTADDESRLFWLICSANLPDKIAIAVDTQMDDGVSTTGTVRALLQVAPNPPVGAGLLAGPAYVENGANTYLICRSL
jgi:prepilin-type N-terminal cleavage/methylation domain-containing protein